MVGEIRGEVRPAHIEKVSSAIQSAFPGAHIDQIAPVGGGASGAFPFRVEIGERIYLVRVEGPTSPLRNPHQYGSMRIAASEGIAPWIHHIDEVDGVAVMDFIREQPLSAFPGGMPALRRRVAGLLRQVQAAPAFPRFVEYPDIVGRLWAWVCRTGLFATGVLDPYTERLERIRDAYVFDPAQGVSSHNDPVPRNILFDGKRLWLIDWESAYRNDPLVDMAITTDNLGGRSEFEEAMIVEWLGRVPDAAIRRRFTLVRALTRLYYAGVLLSASFAASGAVGDRSLSAPTLTALQHEFLEGRLTPGTPEMTHILGKMYLASFLTGVVPPPLDERLWLLR